MANNDIALRFAKGLGLIEGPLFSYLQEDYKHHSVLLNGGRGSFALSSQGNNDVNLDEAASWAWSSDLPHHVFVTEQDVILSRWDDPTSTRRFSRSSVEGKLETFYEYLLLDRVNSKFDVIEHSVDILRRVRSHINDQQIPDEASLHVFLFIIASMLSGRNNEAYANPDWLLTNYTLDPNYIEAFRSLGEAKLSALIEQFRIPLESPRLLQLAPQLLIRHAAGTVFQEAHFEFVRSSPTDLFNLLGAAEIRVSTRGGILFTPPGLARAIIEQAFADSALGESITVFDPACGAGAFLHEVLRYLQRAGYRGRVVLIGFDSSSNAIAMARFALNEARRDWPEGTIEDIRLEVRDSLEETEWPISDFIFMNPPFISWENMGRAKQELVKVILGRWYKGKPDYSMAFIERAISSLKQGGVLGTLLPSSLLSLEASLKWRRHIIDEATPKLLALLGDHGLFRHAIVEVASAILVKGQKLENDGRLISIWTSEKRGASGEALRYLRKFRDATGQELTEVIRPSIESNDWRVTTSQIDVFEKTSDWRPRPNRLDMVLSILDETTETTVGELFQVQQGIRAGHRKAFIITAEDYRRLPEPERVFFRPIAENKNIRDGRIGPHEYIFYPDTVGLPKIDDDSTLRNVLPTYFERFLKPYINDLMGRKSLIQGRWWGLSRSRRYFNKLEPKIVSAYFGDAGSFAFDSTGEYVVVQGFVWRLGTQIRQSFSEVEKKIRDQYRYQVFKAYVALLNSDLFSLLLAEFCPHVAGGQFNLSKKYVSPIPLPNLAKEGQLNRQFGHIVDSLAEASDAVQSGEYSSRKRINELVAEAYRAPLHLWPIQSK
jgi:adenine-specific DNA-methyltransferase